MLSFDATFSRKDKYLCLWISYECCLIRKTCSDLISYISCYWNISSFCLALLINFLPFLNCYNCFKWANFFSKLHHSFIAIVYDKIALCFLLFRKSLIRTKANTILRPGHTHSYIISNYDDVFFCKNYIRLY